MACEHEKPVMTCTANAKGSQDGGSCEQIDSFPDEVPSLVISTQIPKRPGLERTGVHLGHGEACDACPNRGPLIANTHGARVIAPVPIGDGHNVLAVRLAHGLSISVLMANALPERSSTLFILTRIGGKHRLPVKAVSQRREIVEFFPQIDRTVEEFHATLLAALKEQVGAR